MEFIFELSNYDKDAFIEQIGQALEKRTELLSRKKYPKYWSITDHLNAIPKVDEEVLDKRYKRYKKYGVVILCLSMVLLIPSIMDFKHMKFPLFFSLCTLLIGILALRSSKKFKKPKATSFEREALTLYREYNRIDLLGQKIIFTEQNFKIGEELIPYPALELVFEAKDFIVLFYDEKVLVLNKKDLVNDSMEEFTQFFLLKWNK